MGGAGAFRSDLPTPRMYLIQFGWLPAGRLAAGRRWLRHLCAAPAGSAVDTRAPVAAAVVDTLDPGRWNPTPAPIRARLSIAARALARFLARI